MDEDENPMIGREPEHDPSYGDLEYHLNRTGLTEDEATELWKDDVASGDTWRSFYGWLAWEAESC